MDIVEKIREKYYSLTKKQKEVADFMLGNPEDMCFATLKQLSIDIKVSEMTILNFCNALEAGSFNELKYEFRNYVAAQKRAMVQSDDSYQLPYIPKGELENKGDLLHQVCQEEVNALKLFVKDISLEDYFKAAEMINRAKMVIICGRGVSVQVMDFLLTRLVITRVNCFAVNTELSDSVQSCLGLLNKNALLLPVSLPDYYFMTTKLAQYAKDKGVPILAISDRKNSPVGQLSNLCLSSPTETRYFMNTLTGMMMLVNLLTTAVSVERSMCDSDVNAPAKEFGKYFDCN